MTKELKEQNKEIIRTQIHRIINVKANFLKYQGRSKYLSLSERAYYFIYNYDNTHVIHSNETSMFNAMQE